MPADKPTKNTQRFESFSDNTPFPNVVNKIAQWNKEGWRITSHACSLAASSERCFFTFVLEPWA